VKLDTRPEVARENGSAVRQYGRKGTIPIAVSEKRAADYAWPAGCAAIKHCEFELNLMGPCELYRYTGEEAFMATCLNIYDSCYARLVATMPAKGFAPPEGIKVYPSIRNPIEPCDVPSMLRWWV